MITSGLNCLTEIILLFKHPVPKCYPNQLKSYNLILSYSQISGALITSDFKIQLVVNLLHRPGGTTCSSHPQTELWSHPLKANWDTHLFCIIYNEQLAIKEHLRKDFSWSWIFVFFLPSLAYLGNSSFISSAACSSVTSFNSSFSRVIFSES